MAFFNRVPDADGLSFSVDQARAGQSASNIADAFYGAALLYPQQTGYSASMTDGDFVNLVLGVAKAPMPRGWPTGAAPWPAAPKAAARW